MKFSRLSCNVTATGPFQKPACRMKSHSRYRQTWYIGFEVIRRVPEYFVVVSMNLLYTKDDVKFFQINLEVFMKTGSYWRQLLNIKDIDACSVFRTGSRDTMVKEFFTNIMVNIPWIPTKCPLKPGCEVSKGGKSQQSFES
jgi:hypothetical protein